MEQEGKHPPMPWRRRDKGHYCALQRVLTTGLRIDPHCSSDAAQRESQSGAPAGKRGDAPADAGGPLREIVWGGGGRLMGLFSAIR
jgi:hypothetical protein